MSNIKYMSSIDAYLFKTSLRAVIHVLETPVLTEEGKAYAIAELKALVGCLNRPGKSQRYSR